MSLKHAFLKFGFKYGFGSPGQTARTLAKLFTRIKKRNPHASKEEVMYQLLSERMMLRKKILRASSMTDDEIHDLIKGCRGRLGLLVLNLYSWENLKQMISVMSYPREYGLIVEVVGEEVEKYAPGE